MDAAGKKTERKGNKMTSDFIRTTFPHYWPEGDRIDTICPHCGAKNRTCIAIIRDHMNADEMLETCFGDRNLLDGCKRDYMVVATEAGILCSKDPTESPSEIENGA
jgi:hypothetical protein